jgi:predicted transcriptional regulator
MQKVLVSLPDDLATRMRAVIPNRRRSRIIAEVLEKEINRREKELYECAKGVEADDALNKEMSEWNITTGDGIEPESW